MIDKEFKPITLHNGKKKLTIVFRDNKYALLSTFFCVEVDAFEEWIKENIQDVLSGKVEEKSIAGNICELVIRKENTTVYDMLEENGKGNWCTVPTQALLSIIEEWHKQKAAAAVEKSTDE